MTNKDSFFYFVVFRKFYESVGKQHDSAYMSVSVSITRVCLSYNLLNVFYFRTQTQNLSKTYSKGFNCFKYTEAVDILSLLILLSGQYCALTLVYCVCVTYFLWSIRLVCGL